MYFLVILIVFAILFWYVSSSSGLDGFWVASSQFCEDAEIDNFVLMFKKADWRGRCAAYVLLVRDGDVIINEPCSAQITKNWLNRKYSIKFLELEVEGFPLKQTAELDENRLLLFDGDTLYGEFYRDCENSRLLKK